jgi:CRP/FNR family transcriptional regulator
VSSAVALTPCEIVPIDRELVAQEFARDPELALAMMKYLARTVRLLSGQVDQMAFRPARWRVANYLLALSPANGLISCTQDDIASAVSASRVTVSRVLNEFAQKGWVALSYCGVRLLERERLYELCKL